MKAGQRHCDKYAPFLFQSLRSLSSHHDKKSSPLALSSFRLVQNLIWLEDYQRQIPDRPE
ncbi:MAG: hypothetical protein HQK95_09835 [Nitrospirae bacterium]|nr:hypothetical protein [Nitrospirota bacterium]